MGEQTRTRSITKLIVDQGCLRIINFKEGDDEEMCCFISVVFSFAGVGG